MAEGADHAGVEDHLLTRKVFLEGPAGSGKTTYATRHLLRLLERGAQPDRILVLVPQVTLGRPYQLALHDLPLASGAPNIMTLATLARRAVETFWPLISEPMGFGSPAREPTFLNIETAQHFMARFVAPVAAEGRFDSLTIAPPRIVSQVLDNLNRAALMRFPLDEVGERLISAWGSNRDSTRRQVYRTAGELATQFRAHCLQHNLLDFSLVMEAFQAHLLTDPHFSGYLHDQLDFLIADNVEEDTPAAHDFIAWLLPGLRGALIICDSDGGYRTFLGADPGYAFTLQAACEEHLTASESLVMTPALTALARAFNRVIGPTYEPPPARAEESLHSAVTVGFHRFFPQMIDWTAAEVVRLVAGGVPPREIAVLAPFLSDSLRFSLDYRIREEAVKQGIDVPTLSHRPSRALRDEPAARALLTLAALAHPEWETRPPMEDVADTLAHVIDEMDPVRARLLTNIVYRPRAETPALTPFARINPEMQRRIKFRIGERYEALREWLESYKAQIEHEGAIPLDHFWRRLFGEVLSQPGYGFHVDLEAGRTAAQLIASAQGFRAALYPGESQDWIAAGREYVALIHQRLLPALFAQSWQDEVSDAVFLAPASTFLLRNRFVDYQFWLDVGSGGWSERLEQPLTHPYVLRREYPAGQVWTDDMEAEAQQSALYRIVIGLVRRCRRGVYLGIADLGESGFEQRGMLLRVLQQVLRREPGATGELEGVDQS